jgi:ribosomal protein S18 acetylase RimI-like enzyme
MMDLRFLTPDDAAAFYNLRVRSLIDHPEAFHGSPEEWAHIDRAAVVDRIAGSPCAGAFRVGRLVGTALLATRSRTQAKRRHRAEVWNVYVDGEERGHGIAERLLGMVFDAARARGYDSLILTVAAGNDGARRLYERLGFTVYGLEPGATRLPDGRAVDEHLMLKWL